MVESKVVVRSLVGLHARPAALFVQEASQHSCLVWLGSAGKTVNGKSILQVLSLGVRNGTEVTIRTDGTGETVAMERLLDLLANKISAI